MLDFFKKVLKSKKPPKRIAQVKRDTRQQWRKRIEKVKIRPVPGMEWWNHFSRNKKIAIIATSVGIGFIAFFGIRSYFSAPSMYSLDIAAHPIEGGKVSASYRGMDSPLSANYRDGSSVIVTATPSIGYEFHSWDGDIAGFEPVTTITIDDNKEVTANFKPIRYLIKTSIHPDKGGSINHKSGPFEPGSTLELTAAPAPGYHFIGWSGDASGMSPETTIIMDSDKEVTANFSILRYLLKVSVSPIEGGSVSGSGGTYEPGSKATLKAIPAPGYEFTGWSGAISGNSQETTLTMDSDKEVTANFDTIAQQIIYTMPAGEISGSIITFYNTLDQDAIVEGFVELTGEYKARDRTFRWNFEITNPEGRLEDIFRGHWVSDTYHEFHFYTTYSGEYKMRIDHNSRYDLYLVIEIIPKGWKSSKL